MTQLQPHAIPTIGDALREGSRCLRDIGLPSASLEVALLLGMATGLDRLGLHTRTATPLSPEQASAFLALMERRSQREPLQYITGHQEFMGLDFEVTPAVLIPRADTEMLVETILDTEEERGHEDEEPVWLADIGTGSGAIAISLASYLPYLRIVAVDLSEEALAIARRNAEAHDVLDRITFLQGDGLGPLEPYRGKLRYLVSNPPYILDEEVLTLEPEVRDWEPRMALTPGSDPLHWYRVFATQGAEYLQTDGMLAMEVGMDQAQDVAALLSASRRWLPTEVRTDLGGIERVVFAKRA
ncbi:Release factor glutamine methyltransferase [compost metagenome]